MRVISFDEVRRLDIRPAECCRWVEQALTMKREAVLPPKSSLKLDGMPGVFHNVMPCLIPAVNRGG